MLSLNAHNIFIVAFPLSASSFIALHQGSISSDKRGDSLDAIIVSAATIILSKWAVKCFVAATVSPDTIELLKSFNAALKRGDSPFRRNPWLVTPRSMLFSQKSRNSSVYVGAKYVLRAAKHYEKNDGTPFTSETIGRDDCQYWDEKANH